MTAVPNLCAVTFDDGTFNDFTNPTDPTNVKTSVVADPLGVKGNVGRLTYALTNAAFDQSTDQSFSHNINIGFGQTLYGRWEEYIPATVVAGLRRKLCRIADGRANGAYFVLRVDQENGPMGVEGFAGLPGQALQDFSDSGLGTIAHGYNVYEFKLQTNSAWNVSDGILTVRLNGVQVYISPHGMNYLNDPSYFFSSVNIGDQLSLPAGGATTSEFRYVKNIAFSTTDWISPPTGTVLSVTATGTLSRTNPGSANITMKAFEGAYDVSFGKVFTAVSSNPAIATVSVVGQVATVTNVGTGFVTITFTCNGVSTTLSTNVFTFDDYGLDFRNSLAYISDPANCYFEGGNAYPNSNNGHNEGWILGGGATLEADNWETGGDIANPPAQHQLAGAVRVFHADAGSKIFKIAGLFVGGIYELRAALGAFYINSDNYVVVKDGARVLTTISGLSDSSTSGVPKYVDATSVIRPSTGGNWITNNQPFQFTMVNGTELTFDFSNPGGHTGNNCVAHLRITRIDTIPAPAAPVLIAPANLGINLVSPVNFSWNASVSADSYTLQVSTDPAFGSFFYNTSGLLITNVNIPLLVPGTTYYWRVKATNVGGDSVFSTVFSFTTLSPVPPLTVDFVTGVHNPAIGTAVVSDISLLPLTITAVIRYNGSGRFTCAITNVGNTLNGIMDVYWSDTNNRFQAKEYIPERYADKDGVTKGL